MKKTILTLFLISILGFTGIAQVPGAFSYQAVVRNNDGTIVANQNVSFRISILQDSESGDAVYTETHDVITNAFGLAILKIGSGTAVAGTFSPNGWGTASHFIKIELDAEGGSSYTHLSTTQLLAVPYAFHAQTVENDKVNDADADAANEIQTINLSGTELTLSNGGGTVTLPSSGEGGDNWGAQKVVSDATLSGEGTTANPLSVDGDLTDDQILSINGNNLTISEGNTITLPEAEVSKWTKSGDNIFYNKGKAAIGMIPSSLTTTQFSVKATNSKAISATNESSSSAAFYAKNSGSGPSAEFKNHLKIADGTEGDGKVLTSDANGKTSWKSIEESSNKLPIAFGTISNGSLSSGTGIYKVFRDKTGVYRIIILGHKYTTQAYVSNVTLIERVGFVSTAAHRDGLQIKIYNTNGDLRDSDFSFVVYKP